MVFRFLKSSAKIINDDDGWSIKSAIEIDLEKMQKKAKCGKSQNM